MEGHALLTWRRRSPQRATPAIGSQSPMAHTQHPSQPYWPSRTQFHGISVRLGADDSYNGTGDCRSTCSDLRSQLGKPRRPCDAITIKSQPIALAVSAIACAVRSQTLDTISHGTPAAAALLWPFAAGHGSLRWQLVGSRSVPRNAVAHHPAWRRNPALHVVQLGWRLVTVMFT
jgi:hypothetical protein